MRCSAEEPAAGLPPSAQHAKKSSMEDVFEHRWRKAYEVRALERESRAGNNQGGSRCGNADARHSPGCANSAPNKPPAASAPTPAAHTGTSPLEVQASVVQAAAEALGTLTMEGTPGGAAGAAHGKAKLPRQQEIIDDDEEEEEEEDAGTTAGAVASSRAGQPTQQQLHGQSEDDEEEGLACKLVWDSSSHRRSHVVQSLASAAATVAGGEAAALLKEQGNACLKARDFQGAVRCYTGALAACKQHQVQWRQATVVRGKQQGTEQQQLGAEPQQAQQHHQEQQEQGADQLLEEPGRQLLATLHSNRAHALLRLKLNEEAATDAVQAHRLHPTWSKPLYRLAQAKLALGQWAAAISACRRGEALVPKNSECHTEFTPLLDRTAVLAARAGSLAGYDGIQLEVRDAGKEAWLCRPAPHVPELDGPEDEDTSGVVTHLPLPSSSTPGTANIGSGAGAGGVLAMAGAAAALGSVAGEDPLVAWHHRPAALGRRRTSFRSIKEAVVAAQDGDRIVLRRGTHNGMGESITITKRLLIEGEGALGEAVIDQRANCPTFRIARGGVVLRGIDLDQTGFREALLVEGPAGACPQPLLQDCRFKCSGDDAVCTGGAAVPTFLRCIIQSKKCGVKAHGSSAPRFERCSIEKCGEQGLRAMEAAAPLLHGCTISECAEEGVVGMDTARLTLHGCSIRNCKGPGVDLSGGATATITGGRIRECVGGLWLWDAATAAVQRASVAGGPSHAILADGAAALQVRESTVTGTVHASDAAWQGILHPSNHLLDPEEPTDFPAEEGPFRFVPNRFTRKQ